MEILSPLNQSIFQWDKSCQDESVDNFDLSMNMSAVGAENADGYMSVDQTFHTPSFGDEEFDIPPINLPPSSGSNANPSDLYITSQAMSHQQQDQNNSNHHMSQNPQQQQQPPPTSCSQSMAMSLSDPSRVMTTMSSTPSPSMNMMDGGQPHQYPGPQHHEPPNQHDMYNMQMASTGAMLPPQSVQFQVQQYAVPTSYANSSMQTHMQSLGGPLPPGVHHHQQQQPQQHSLSVLPHQMHHFHPNAHHMQQQQQQQQHQQQILPPTSMLSLQLGPPRLPRPASVGSSPPGSNHTSPGLETSEDSDDSGHISQLMGGIKRPSPEPVERPPSGGKSIKKPKVQKKKKKRDPNEPQKPVSAYALFFRDTQAAIKGQNPNASFGEVSKIVASMWDSLDIEHKNVYKKKTEAAKKEYLKALAAYRASLVTKAANDQSDSIYGSKGGVPTSSSMQSGSVHSQTLSPLQKKSPLLASLMEGTAMTSLQNMTQPQPLMVGQGQMGGSNGVLHHQHMLSQHMGQHGPPPQQMLHHLSPNGQMMQTMAIRPPPVSQMMTLNPNHSHQVQQAGLNNNNNHNYSQNMMPSSPQLTHPGQSMNQGMMNPSQMQNCLRNPPTGNEPQDWEREYCNNDCVVSHCRDVYTTWVSSRQPPNSYASVK